MRLAIATVVLVCCSSDPVPVEAGADSAVPDAADETETAAEAGGTTYVSSGGGAIPDGPGNCFGGGDCGCAGTELVLPITVNDDFPFTNVSVVLVGLEHPFVGHVRLELKHVDTTKGAVFVMRTRLGATTFNDCGDDSDVLGNYTFDDRAMPVDGWVQAAGASTCGPTCVIAPGTYHPMSTNLTPTFAGDTSKGTWELHVSDMGLGSTGKIASWKLVFE